ncbi:MAG: TIGR00730 family Rossman fold protein [Clostridia bacterium]|nr:TIGR00730 family Rossman fold protein [Clostridia bacterium]
MNVCLYGASSSAIAKSYINPVKELGFLLASRGHTLVFGGGAHGLMGAAARGFASGGGKIIGVAPSFFQVDGVLFDRCDEFIGTKTMSERKEWMEENADAFIIAPGGPGTLDEFFQVLTLKQLGRHAKPIAIYNLHGFYDSLLLQMKSMAERQFMPSECFRLFSVTNNPDKVVQILEAAEEGVDPTGLKFF